MVEPEAVVVVRMSLVDAGMHHGGDGELGPYGGWVELVQEGERAGQEVVAGASPRQSLTTAGVGGEWLVALDDAVRHRLFAFLVRGRLAVAERVEQVLEL